MNERIKEIRKKIISCYGMDIEEATCFFSTSNYAFIFKEQPYMIRVNLGVKKTRQELLSEYMWLDDLKMFADTVCAPQPSLNSKPIEEFNIDGVYYKATMFKCAKGKAKSALEFEPINLINIGDFLGRIHAAGMDAIKSGFSYKRNKGLDISLASLERVRANVPSNILGRIESTIKKVSELPEDSRYFGMLHGDFHHSNFFMDGNNVWTFDFDECHYGFFLYDIASICHSLLLFGYHFGSGKTSREILNQDILPYFRMGYELHMQFPTEHWELFDLFLEFRFCTAAMGIYSIKELGILPDLEKTREFVCFPLTQPDMLVGSDMMLQKNSIMVMNY